LANTGDEDVLEERIFDEGLPNMPHQLSPLKPTEIEEVTEAAFE